MATENKGIIYYKLDPDYHFSGDYTKNCGLNGGEIDGNFHFLRGYDISSFDMSENKEELVITRLNGEELKVNIKENFAGYDFEYDKFTGVLKITMPYGETIDLDGFLTEKFFRVYGDFTIDGDGTRYSPIRMASIAKTGTYRPAKTLLDLTDENSTDELPSKNIALNDRYVTREKVSKYGLLYPLYGVDAIKERLEEIGSEWRVPTKEDWDQLLNIIEECPEDKDHDGVLTNKYFGLNAGAYLKSVDQWAPYYRELENGEIVLNGERYTKDVNGQYVPNEDGEYLKVNNSEDKFGFAIYPVGFGGRRGVDSIGGFGEWAAYWSSSEEDKNRDMYVKVFSFDQRTVEQNTWGRDCYLSLRLVKDYNGENLYDVENIDGATVTTKHFVMENDEDKKKYDTTLIWTCENVGFSNPQYGGVKSPEWPNEEGTSFVIRYYVNDWDGEKWIKNEIQEGESIVIFEENGVKMHEWRLVNGILVDTLEITMNEVAKDFAEVDERLNVLESGLAQEIIDRIAADEVLQGNIEAEAQAREAADMEIVATITTLSDALKNEAEAREAADDVLQGNIEAEAQAREAADEVLQGNIEAEAQAREAADEVLQGNIDTVIDNIEQITEDIQNKFNELDATDSVLRENIELEAEARKATDNELKKNIDENKVVLKDTSLVLEEGATINNVTTPTTIKLNIPENSMIRIDEYGIYFDGDFNVGTETKINNKTQE